MGGCVSEGGKGGGGVNLMNAADSLTPDVQCNCTWFLVTLFVSID